jgi:CyaY protein
MNDSEYTVAVAQVFKRLVKAIDGVDPDVLEADSTGDMVTMTARSGEKVIVNTQRAVHQIWVAGKGMGVHFSREGDGRWMDDKGKGLELLAWVADCVQTASGTVIKP